MGIFNEHSSGQQYAQGIQGAPGVGFNLTADGNYDMVNKKLQMLDHQHPILMLQPKNMLMTILAVEHPPVLQLIQTLT